MNYYIFTFGCQMNVSDSLWLDQALQALGLKPCSREEEADIFLINTCSVREKPEQKIYSLLGRLYEYTREKPHVFAGVGGCVAQQVGRRFLERFSFVRLVFGTDGLVMVPEAIKRLLKDRHLKTSLLDFQDHYPERKGYQPEKAPVQAFVNIMQGCDNFCAYCIVPYTRGRQKSRSSREILQECAGLVARGCREITLLGQNVNSFGQDKEGRDIPFSELLRSVAALPGLERLRFTTSHPKDIDEEVIQAFGELPALCPHLHLPLQSGSDQVLSSMGRKYNSDDYLRIVEKLRSSCPDISLTTDLIVGFPGETDADFENTMDIVKKVGFDSSFSFKYSDRPGVRAADMQPKIDDETKTERLARLQQLQSELTRDRLAGRVGRQELVLVEGRSKKQGPPDTVSWTGRDPGGRLVHVHLPVERDCTGEVLRVTIVRAHKHSLSGEVI
ncbi:tRNA (N6-isopentenyl adenosine(37)-C2)-methylthiotransferase MiaB [Desulfonatronospira sp. MSAO_Bac3]|uniref:tRNA (N6-isopentenyl adenosine(37)-C2)-methylthiotransferase MiaB n=1 Tax=Desulfonatronospira sp. MSAO_Bac3 TaxID=2293857 RepID=UPI000FF78A7D|nr:tRNA (N6-isopentenyl adenosine(37)-C2)-methylthiotransferase MiaB [Desulfonatronospira sp. MSAO_Bac3]RQD73951.1 MAG: tRNA (N6-isopentenyl adenosine(37)-C2)-methylthiotransferase MiaB [Desulfonatronospira sp. MSAO_Bac3]